MDAICRNCGKYTYDVEESNYLYDEREDCYFCEEECHIEYLIDYKIYSVYKIYKDMYVY